MSNENQLKLMLESIKNPEIIAQITFWLGALIAGSFLLIARAITIFVSNISEKQKDRTNKLALIAYGVGFLMTTAPLILDLITQEPNSQKWLKHVYQVTQVNGAPLLLAINFTSFNPRAKWTLTLISLITFILSLAYLTSLIENDF